MQINLGHVTASFTLDVYGHTENASIVEHLCIGDCQGLYIERPDDNSLIWGDASVGGGFALASDNLDKTAIKKIAEKISAK